MADYLGRIGQLQRHMVDMGASLALFGPSDQMRYLIGWAESGHERLLALLVPSSGAPALLVPSINAQHAGHNPAGVSKVIGWNDADGWRQAAAGLLSELNVSGAGEALVDDELMCVHLLGFEQLAPDLHWLAAGETMARLRETKGDEELVALKRAADIIDDVFLEVVSKLTEGMMESDLVDEVHASIKRRGSVASFGPLVCFGANGAMPHHHSGETKLKKGDIVVIDIGSAWDGYASDITRTVSFGPPSDPDANAVYDVVYRGHMAARAAVRPGVTAERVDAEARNVIGLAGYGEQFIHRTGHGIGLSGHEQPYIVAGNTAILQPGMCFSIEPGIYLPDRFGVRIENIVTVTGDGGRSLNAEPAEHLAVV